MSLTASKNYIRANSDDQLAANEIDSLSDLRNRFSCFSTRLSQFDGDLIRILSRERHLIRNLRSVKRESDPNEARRMERLEKIRTEESVSTRLKSAIGYLEAENLRLRKLNDIKRSRVALRFT